MRRWLKKAQLGAIFLLIALFSAQAPAGRNAIDFVPLDKRVARSLTDPAAHTEPTIVALWSAECTHCKKNLALFAQLLQREKRLKFISVATETATPLHQRHLGAISLPGRHYAYGDEMPEALAYALDPSWHGELPRTLLFDGKGGKTAVSGVLEKNRIRAALGLGR